MHPSSYQINARTGSRHAQGLTADGYDRFGNYAVRQFPNMGLADIHNDADQRFKPRDPLTLALRKAENALKAAIKDVEGAIDKMEGQIHEDDHTAREELVSVAFSDLCRALNMDLDLGTEGYEKSGYNADGYDAEGFDREGYDADGYDAHGYDADGYDAEGYDAQGYDAHGYDAWGYDKIGYHAGLNRAGWDRDGNKRSANAESQVNLGARPSKPFLVEYKGKKKHRKRKL